MVIRVALCAILFASGASAQWKRYLQLAGGGTDSPPGHDLRYFRVDPCSRSDKQDRVVQCSSWPSADELKLRSETRTNLRFVGKINSFSVYDLEYVFAGGPTDRTGPDVNSVLVETAGHQFHEIQVTQRIAGTIFPTEIIYAGDQPIIAPKYEDGGMHRWVVDVYFVISDTGSVMLDFGPVKEAAERAVPSGMTTCPPPWYDFKSLVFNIMTSDWEGYVEVPFMIEKTRVIPGTAKYTHN